MKRLLSFVLCLFVLVGCLPIASSAQDIIRDNTFVVADADDSGMVNAMDSYTIKAVLSGTNSASFNSSAADLDADGMLSAKDSYFIRLYLAGKISSDDVDTDYSLYKLTIGGYDISEFCIVMPAGTTSDDNASYAARELRDYIRDAVGIEPVRCYADEERPKPHAFVFHSVDEDSELGTALGIEGYKYDVTDGDVNIYGTRRGNMYWVYDFLERLGYEFFSDTATFIWKTRSVHVPEGETGFAKPQLSFRFAGQTFDSDGAQEHYFPNKLNGTQLYAYDGTRYGTLTGPHFINAHSMGYYWRMGTGIYTDDEHLKDCYESGEQKEESDYGATPAWQPCASNESVYQTLFLGLTRTMTMIQQWGHEFRKNTSSMSFSICDNTGGYCTCRNCTKKSRTEGYSGVYVDLTNRAARDIKEIYPDMKLMTIIYDHAIPETVRPEENVIIFFCGQGCNNHYFGCPDDCGDNGPAYGKLTNKTSGEALKAWTEFCHEAGGELWFWYYPVTYRVVIAPCPNVLNIYYDMMFIINECGVDGFYYEGGGELYAFESLKAHMAVKIMNDPDMTYEEFESEAKDFLYFYYGAGYEYVWEYALMQTEAGNTDNCYVNNYSLPEAMYDFDYLEENYLTMRALIENALEMTDDAEQTKRLNMLLCTCDFIGLSAVYESWYANGTEETKALYTENIEWMISFVKANEMHFGEPSFLVPDEICYSCNLCSQMLLTHKNH